MFTIEAYFVGIEMHSSLKLKIIFSNKYVWLLKQYMKHTCDIYLIHDIIEQVIFFPRQFNV